MIFSLALASFLSAKGQDTNEPDALITQLDVKGQSVGLNLGMLDYSTLTTEFSYKRGVSIFNKTFMIGTEIAFPVFEPDVNDMRFRVITIQTSVLRKGKFDMSLKFAPTITTTNTKTHKLVAIGEGLSIISGFYGEKWGGSFIIDADFVNATKVEHTDYYKEVVYEDVYDGWLQNPAGNLRMGLMATRKMNNFEASVKIGYGSSFKGSYMLFPPVFGVLGIRYVF